MRIINRIFLKDLLLLTRGYWNSPEKWRARALLAVIVGLNLGHVYLLVLLNAWNNRFYNALQNYDKSEFFSALNQFCVLATIAIVISVYEQYLQQMLEINWRRWMTEHYLQDWLSNKAYFLLELKNVTDNPDQRISEDLRLFVSLTLSLSLGLLKATVTLLSFVLILWRLSGSMVFFWMHSPISIPGYMVWVAIVYAIVGTWMTTQIGYPLVGLNFNQQRYEADFRFSLVRLRENSEGIAFYGGEGQEAGNFTLRFRRVFDNFYALMRRQKRLTWFTSGYGQIAIIFPFLVAAPRYFSYQIQLGGLIQTATAFGRVQDALSFFVDSYSSLAEWQAVVNRLNGFMKNVRQVQVIREQTTLKLSHGSAGMFSVEGLDVILPDGARLLDNLKFSLVKGDSLLITGPSGSGKSTLLRTLAGIWPFGRGTIHMPAGESLLFLPQKAYLPLGTLREVLLYPRDSEWVTDQEVCEVLVLCKLSELIPRRDIVENWSQVLSPGEQQRIAFARAILLKPAWLFLDEATSALDEPTEQHVYELLDEYLSDSVIVSVGHRRTLTGYHKLCLAIDEAGNWKLSQQKSIPAIT